VYLFHVSGSAQRTIVTVPLQDLITGHNYRLPASEWCDPVRYGESSPLKLKNRCWRLREEYCAVTRVKIVEHG